MAVKSFLALALVAASTTLGRLLPDDKQMPIAETTSYIEATEQQPLVEWRGKNAVIWVSHISPVFFGQDAEGYDYEMIDCGDRPIESVYTLNDTFYSDASEFALMVALLNTTMGGTMSEEQSHDVQYLCRELGFEPAAYVAECKDVEWDDNAVLVVRVKGPAHGHWTDDGEWEEDGEPVVEYWLEDDDGLSVLVEWVEGEGWVEVEEKAVKVEREECSSEHVCRGQ